RPLRRLLAGVGALADDAAETEGNAVLVLAREPAVGDLAAPAVAADRGLAVLGLRLGLEAGLSPPPPPPHPARRESDREHAVALGDHLGGGLVLAEFALVLALHREVGPGLVRVGERLRGLLLRRGHPERQRNGLRVGLALDRAEHVHLERLADAVARQVLQRR